MKDQIKLDDLIPDDRNANIHSEKGTKMLAESIERNGLGRSILISNDNEIIAGNGVCQSVKNTDIQKIRVIETDGTELIAIKRTDINSKSKEFYDMALSDNIVSKENIIIEADVVNAICEDYDIDEFKDDLENNNKIKKENLIPFKKTHILLSFHPDLLIDIQDFISQIVKIQGVEYEQSSN